MATISAKPLGMRLALGLILAIVGIAVVLTVLGILAWTSRQYAVGYAPRALRLVLLAAVGGGMCTIGGGVLVVSALRR